MTTSEFAYICKHPEIIAAQFVAPLEETAQRFPFCQSAHILSAKYYEDIDETTPKAQLKLRKAALYCTDRAMLKAIMDRDPAQLIEQRKAQGQTTIGRSKKIKTSVIHTKANPSLKVELQESPASKKQAILDDPSDNVQVPEIILPNEKLLGSEISQPLERKTQVVMNLSKPDTVRDTVYSPISVQQPYGEALFNELYKNLKELGQKKKKVSQILDKLPLSQPAKAHLPETKSESSVKVVTITPVESEEEAPLKTKEQKTSSVPQKEATQEATQVREKAIPEKKKPVAGNKPTSTKKTVKNKAADTPSDEKNEITTNKVVIEENTSKDETDLLLEYLNQLSHEEEQEETSKSVKKNDLHELERQQNLIDNFLKDLPTLRENRIVENAANTGDLSEQSTQAPNMVSENLAKIYERQGNKAKAIEVYQKLILKYPEKSSYFAASIEKLESNS